MDQASLLDDLALDACSVEQTSLTAAVVVAVDESFDLRLEIVRPVVVFSRMRFFRVWCQRSILPFVWGCRARREHRAQLGPWRR